MLFIRSLQALLLLAITFVTPNLSASDELLEVDQAFQLQEVKVDGQNFIVEWKVADEYYLYKKRFSIESSNLTLGEASYSKSKTKDDVIFGKTEVYFQKAKITQPFTGQASETELTIKYQGCADRLGVCYPPQTRKVTVSIPAPAMTGTGFEVPDSLGALNDLLIEDSGSELLPADEAFAFSHSMVDGKLQLNWNVASGYHLYRDKIKVSVETGSADLMPLELPPSVLSKDPVFGEVNVYKGTATAYLSAANIADNTTIDLSYQGCSSESGVCYPPEHKKITLNPAEFTPPPAGASIATATVNDSSNLSETDQIANTLKNSSVWIVLGTFFLFGLLLALTPCVFPMIPILSSLIVGQGENLSTRKAFVMSLVYVLAMSITYTVAGVLAGLFGENLQAAFQNPWIIGTFSLVFVALAFSMFGFYELKLPNSLQNKITNLSNKQEGGTLTGVAIMGFLSALIVGPCVAPPLAGALIYIGQTGDALLGGFALFAMSMGMGLPLILLGTSAGKLMPRAGGWMNQVTVAFGVIMLGLAIWMAERILPAVVTNFAWAALLIGSAIYMGVFESSKEKSGWQKFFQSIAMLFFLYGALIIVGVAGGSQSLLKPLEVFKGGATMQTAQQQLSFKKIKSIEDLNAELATAKANKQTVMLDFYADWCVSCKEMEQFTFTDSKVINRLNNTVLLKADVTKNDDIDKTLMKKFGIIGPPAILFFKDGEERAAQRVVGFKPADDFLQSINKAFK